MSATPLDHTPGVFVLGMHRSGTSVISGILERLGLDAGPREMMVAADEFNSDGYWEHRPLVALNDTLLRTRNGFASAPPPPSGVADDEQIAIARPAIEEMLRSFRSPWFLKDPRHCLVLPTWTEVLGDTDLAVVVNRDPASVIRSLRHRNGYRPDLAAGLWEEYVRALLRDLGSRPCHFVQYERLLAEPRSVVAELATALEDHVGLVSSEATIDHATALVRPAPTASSSTGTFTVEPVVSDQQELADLLASLEGTHDGFDATALPPRSEVGRSAITWRRRRIRVAARLFGSDPESNARRDRRR